MTTTQPTLFETTDFTQTDPEHMVRPITCPACGYTTVGTMRGVRMYHGWAEAGGVCISMDLTRNHVLAALRDGREVVDKHKKKGTRQDDFDDTIRRAIELWGDRAHEFVPADHWPSDI